MVRLAPVARPRPVRRLVRSDPREHLHRAPPPPGSPSAVDLARGTRHRGSGRARRALSTRTSSVAPLVGSARSIVPSSSSASGPTSPPMRSLSVWVCRPGPCAPACTTRSAPSAPSSNMIGPSDERPARPQRRPDRVRAPLVVQVPEDAGGAVDAARLRRPGRVGHPANGAAPRARGRLAAGTRRPSCRGSGVHRHRRPRRRTAPCRRSARPGGANVLPRDIAARGGLAPPDRLAADRDPDRRRRDLRRERPVGRGRRPALPLRRLRRHVGPAHARAERRPRCHLRRRPLQRVRARRQPCLDGQSRAWLNGPVQRPGPGLRPPVRRHQPHHRWRRHLAVRHHPG